MPSAFAHPRRGSRGNAHRQTRSVSPATRSPLARSLRIRGFAPRPSCAPDAARPLLPIGCRRKAPPGAGLPPGTRGSGGRSDGETSEEGVRRGPVACVGIPARRAKRREAWLQRLPGSCRGRRRSEIQRIGGCLDRKGRLRHRASMHGWRPPATTNLEEGRQGSDGVERRGTLAAPSHRGFRPSFCRKKMMGSPATSQPSAGAGQHPSEPSPPRGSTLARSHSVTVNCRNHSESPSSTAVATGRVVSPARPAIPVARAVSFSALGKPC